MSHCSEVSAATVKNALAPIAFATRFSASEDITRFPSAEASSGHKPISTMGTLGQALEISGYQCSSTFLSDVGSAKEKHRTKTCVPG
eukprot:CAMPEP_0167774650 /NCGR_PEP_ID=MMETSP0111_2-20121227/2120_1 /TAXON_ID=91324 /ORGANISM="Lotharella globosa, Strain CCCM811" /LENGTH=86 /DNA_ID=CAMNT_0007664475 /DNA_START=113 /DNA_END=373 /DNA_ORIENTATION=-